MPFYPINQANGSEPYIHLSWEHFKEISPTSDVEISEVYKQQKLAAKSRFSNLLGVSDSEASKIIQNVVGMYEVWNDNETNKTLESELLSGIQKTVSEMNDSNLSSDLHHTKIDEVLADTAKFNKVLENQKVVMESIDEIDKRILDYYTNVVGSSHSSYLKAPVNLGDGLETLANTGKVNTSVNNWKRGWAKVDSSVSALGAIPKSVTFKRRSGKKDKDVSVDVSKVMSDTVGHMNNIKGEILEVGLTALARGAMADFQKAFESAGVTNGTVVQLGDEKIKDPNLNRKVTRKTDVGIGFEIAATGMKVTVGFSAKGQFKNGPTKKTDFLKSNYKDVMSRANLLNSYIEYNLNNMIAHDKYAEAQQLRKLVGAKLSLAAMGGIQGIDEVHFIVYLDKIISLSDVFAGMEANPKNGVSIDVTRSSLATAAAMDNEWVRSHKTTQSIYKLVTKVTGKT